jgi:hypothetical protein
MSRLPLQNRALALAPRPKGTRARRRRLDPTAALPAAMLHAFAETTRLLYVSEDLDETLLRVTTLATQTIEGCEVASLTMKEGSELVTRAPTGELAVQCDRIQYEEGEGPCLDAALHEGRRAHP